MTLSVFVEGNDDEDFFRLLSSQCDFEYQEIIQHASMPNDIVNNFLKLHNEDYLRDYIFVVDSDNFSDEESKISKICNIYSNLDKDKVVVAIKSIESWYIAGFDKNIAPEHFKKIKDNNIRNSKCVGKKEFYSIKSKLKIDLSDKEFLLEIKEYFSIDKAIHNNDSFKNFHKNYIVR